MKNKESDGRLIVYALYLFIAIIYIIGLSYSTSFVFPRYWGSDSAIFQTIGMGWSKGALPYVDLFDHKGPIIFFIDMIGYLMTGTSTGVLIIQMISFFIFVLLLHSIHKVSGISNIKAFLYTLLVIMFLTFSYDEGNMTEEYMLPYIALSFLCAIKYFKEYEKGKIEHSTGYGFIYGIGFSFGLMTRLTNSLPIIVIVAFITALLIVNKQWKNLVWNIFSFLGGCLLVILPFVIYFSLKGALSELLWGTIGYNLFYTNKNAELMIDLSEKSVRRYLFALAPIIGILLMGIRTLKNKKYVFGSFYCILGLAEILLFLNISFYPHYTMIVVPNISLILFELSSNPCRVKWINRVYYAMVIVFCLISTNFAYNNIKWMYQWTHNHEPEYLQFMNDNSINDSVIVYNTDNKCLYLDLKIIPQYRYFALQDRYGEFCDTIEEDIHDIYEEASAEWLIVKGEETIIDDILKDKYHIVKEYKDQDIIIWALN